MITTFYLKTEIKFFYNEQLYVMLLTIDGVSMLKNDNRSLITFRNFLLDGYGDTKVSTQTGYADIQAASANIINSKTGE